MKKIISLICVCVLIATSLALAENSDFIIENGTLVSYVGSSSDVNIPSDVYFIGENAFADKTFINNVNFTENIVSIGRRAFKNCSGLTSVKISPRVTTIATDAFSGCVNLADVTLNDYLSVIGAGVFQNCPIKSLIIPYSVKNIGMSAFDGNKMNEITIPSTVIAIGDFAFGKNNNILIKGVEGTRAQSFAQRFNHLFVPIAEPYPLPIPPKLPEIELPEIKIRDNSAGSLYINSGEKPADYAIYAVNYLARNTEIDEGFFSDYKRVVTREECAYYLIHVYYKLKGEGIDLSSQTVPFADTHNNYVTKAKELAIVNGTDLEKNLFSPNNPVTREQMTSYFVRMLDLCNIDYNKSSTEDIVFSDAADISSWALEDIRRAYYLGLINGTGNNNVSPQNDITREQVFTMLGNLLTNLNKIKNMYTRGNPINTPELMYYGIGRHKEGHVDEAYYSAPSVVDLNGDGRLEIISTAYSIFNIDAPTGQINWRIPSGYDRNATADTKPVGRGFADVITKDIDSDGSLEIVVGHSVNYDGNTPISTEFWRGVVAAYDKDGYFKPGWPQYLPRPVNSVTVYDLDGDGTSEIVVGISIEGSQSVYVFDHRGNVLSGWPQLKPEFDATQNVQSPQNTGYQYGIFHNNIAVGDINNDGKPEIVVPSDIPFICAYDMYGNLIKANPIFGDRTWGRVGTWEDYEFEKELENEGWGNSIDWQTGMPIDLFSLPREKRNIASFTGNRAIIQDVDGDGINEVVVVGTISDRALSWPELPLYQSPFIFNGDRTRFKTDKYDWTKIPVDTGNILSTDWLEIEICDPTPVVTDINMDGVNEILYPSSAGKVMCFSLDRKDEWSYWVCDDTVKEFASALEVVDINNDGLKEIIFTTIAAKKSGKTGSLVILDSKGHEIQRIALPGSFDPVVPNGSIARPIVCDIDYDGNLEVVINSHLSGVVVYKLR